MPFARRLPRSRCNASASGVVSSPGMSPSRVSMPTVPTLAALKPEASQICRTNETIDDLPLVPVTPTIVSGCGANCLAAARAYAARASGTTTTGMPGSVPGLRSVIIALAPLARACAANASPCVWRPGMAKNTSPGLIARLSALTPSTVSRGDLLPAPFSSSVRANDTGGNSSKALAELRRDKFTIQHRIVVGADAQERGDAGNDAAGRLAGVPAGGVTALPRLGVRIVDQDHHRIARIVHRQR